MLPEGLRGKDRGVGGWGQGRDLLVLGMEELDEALQEVGPLLQLALPGSQQVLGKEQGQARSVSRSGILGARGLPSPSGAHLLGPH